MPGQRVLLVDDEQRTLLLLRESLMASGLNIEAMCVSSAEEALQAFARQPFDVVISDLRLVGMDGLELLERLRPLYPCVRAIIVSGHADAASQAAAQRLGVFHYFRKPFALDEFTGVVADALREATMDVNNSSGTQERHVQLIHHQLLALKRDTGAQAAILTDRDGMMIAHVGDMNGFEKPLTGAAASPGNAFNFVYHQGRTHDIYLADIGNGMRLGLVFDRNQPSSRIGLVLQYTRRAAQELLDLESAGEQATG